MKPGTRLVLVLLLTALAAGRGAAQPRDVPPVARLLPYLGDERFQRELRLTPDQLKTLLAHRRRQWDGAAKAPGDSTADRGLATVEAFRAALAPEQMDRARQLGLRVALKTPDRRPPDTTRLDALQLRAAPRLVAELLFDADQRAIVGTGRVLFPGRVFLTPAQSAALDILLGPPADTDWEPDFGPSPGGAPRDPVAARMLLTLTNNPDVRADLKLTDEQVRALDALRAARSSALGGPRLTPDGRDREVGKVEEQADQALTPDQRVRVRQIYTQRFTFTLAADRFDRADVLTALAVGADQTRALVTARAAFADAVARAALSGVPADEVKRAVADATAARDRAFHAALTPDQRAKADAVFGAPYAGRISLDPKARESARASRAARFGRYREELSVLTLNKTVQDELKLAPDRVKLLREASLRKPRVPFEPTSEAADEVSEFVGKTLNDLLTLGQARRFRQVMLQSLERGPAERLTLEIPSAVAYPGVADAVKLTDAQRASLIDGEHPRDVLSPEQHVAVRAMLGAPFRGAFGTGSLSRAPAPGPRGDALTELPWATLALPPERTTAAVRALNKHHAARASSEAGGAGPFGKNKTAEPDAAGKLEAELAAALSPDELRRLDRLVVRHAFLRDPRGTLTDPDAAVRLGLAPDQLRRLYSVEQEWRKVVRLVLNPDIPADRRRDLVDRLHQQFDERLLAVLTPAQRQSWDDLAGGPVPNARRPLPVFAPVW